MKGDSKDPVASWKGPTTNGDVRYVSVDDQEAARQDIMRRVDQVLRGEIGCMTIVRTRGGVYINVFREVTEIKRVA